MLIALLSLALDLHQPRIPVHFEPNQGQVSGETEWIAQGRRGMLYIKGSAIAFETHEPHKNPRIMRFVGVNAPIPSRDRQGAVAADARGGQGIKPTGGYSNYFDGRDDAHWRTGIPHYAKVQYKNLYEGIDLVYYATKDGQIEYDFEVQPGADLSQIHLAFDGFDKIEINADGDLVMDGFKQRRPVVIQGGREIPCTYQLSKNHVRLDVAPYNPELPLTVDPVLDFSTYLGGPGYDALYGGHVDSNGFTYVCGLTQTPSSPSLNPFQQPSLISERAVIFKFTPNADRILLFTSLGGDSGFSRCDSMHIDGAGNMLLYGSTTAADFPVKNAFQKDYKATLESAFVAKLSADGRSILYSSYWSGSQREFVHGSALGADGSLYFGGATLSRDIPILNPYMAQSPGGQGKCYLAKVSASGALVFSTYFGGSQTDYCSLFGLGNSGELLIGGESYSDDLPLMNPIQTVRSPRGGFPTAFFSKLSGDGSQLIYSTFLGGQGSGGIDSAAMNSKGELYLGGHAYGGAFATTPGAFQGTCEPDTCGLLMKLDPAGKKVLVSTMLAGTGRTSVSSIAAGSDDSVYLAGLTSASDLPAPNSLLPFVGGGFANQDAFAAKFLGDLRTLVYSTFIGGTNDEELGGTMLDSQGRQYVFGWTQSADFPVKSAFQTKFGGQWDAFLVRISDSTAPVASPITAAPGQVQLKYVQVAAPIVPQTVQLSSDAPVAFTASANAAWVTVLPQSGTTPAILSIGASPLNPGNYAAVVTVAPAAGAPLNIPVTLKILTPAPQLTSVEPAFVALGSDDTVLTFHGSGFTPQTQLLIVGGIAWGYPITFVDSQTLQTTVPYISFIFEGSYPFAAMNPQSDVSGTVTVSIGRLTPVITSVVNAASQLSGPLAAGELVQINGSNFGPPAQMSVSIGGIPATVVSSTDTQALAIVPNQVPGVANAPVVLTSGALPSLPAPLPVAPVAPGLFTADNSGVGQALVSGAASPGFIITLFGTGIADLTQAITVSMNGEDSPVTGVSAVDGQPGWFQITVTVPGDLSTDSPVAVLLSVAGVSSQPGVTLALTSPQ